MYVSPSPGVLELARVCWQGRVCVCWLFKVHTQRHDREECPWKRDQLYNAFFDIRLYGIVYIHVLQVDTGLIKINYATRYLELLKSDVYIYYCYSLAWNLWKFIRLSRCFIFTCIILHYIANYKRWRLCEIFVLSKFSFECFTAAVQKLSISPRNNRSVLCNSTEYLSVYTL